MTSTLAIPYKICKERVQLALVKRSCLGEVIQFIYPVKKHDHCKNEPLGSVSDLAAN